VTESGRGHEAEVEEDPRHLAGRTTGVDPDRAPSARRAGAVGAARSGVPGYRLLWSRLERWLRVPEDPPDLPIGADERLDVLKPSPRHLRLMQIRFAIAATIVVVAVLVVWILLAFESVVAAWIIMPIVATAIVLVLLAAWIGLHLRYDATWYVLTSRAVRIRRGVWVLREITVTFENVQNLSVRQGPIQRWLGLRDLVLETAAAAGGSESGVTDPHRAALEGIEDAERLREVVLARVRRSGGTGLGDEESRGPEPVGRRRAVGARSETPVGGLDARHRAVLREIRDLLRSGAVTGSGEPRREDGAG